MTLKVSSCFKKAILVLVGSLISFHVHGAAGAGSYEISGIEPYIAMFFYF